jgi:hypothetical protein
MASEIQCLACSCPIPLNGTLGAFASQCPRCFAAVEAALFPAMSRPAGGALPERVEAETDASCFFHPRNRAAVACDECGRFLCKLCELEVPGARLCPDCFNKGARGTKKSQFDAQRVMHDSVALALALFPLLFWPVIVITAPATLFWVVRYWNRSGSIVPRSRIRFCTAALIALLEIAGVTAVIIAIAKVS